MSTNSKPAPAEAFEEDHWEEFLQKRYPENEQGGQGEQKKASEFRDYRKEARPSVKEFYKTQSHPPDLRLRPAEAQAVSRARQAQNGHLGGNGISQYAC
jgi:hypothetical protein